MRKIREAHQGFLRSREKRESLEFDDVFDPDIVRQARVRKLYRERGPEVFEEEERKRLEKVFHWTSHNTDWEAEDA